MKISVIMPAYNSEKTIEKSINSILSQSGANVEVIVIDDGSTDSTKDIIKKYADRIISVTIPNGGVANARNTAMEIATGDYVMFVDSDDLLADGAIETLASKISETKVDMVRFEYVISDSDGNRSLSQNRFNTEEIVENDEFSTKIYPHFIRGIRMNSLCTTISRRELFEGLKFRTDMKTAEDAYLMTDVYTRAKSVLILPEELYIYNRQEDSLTGRGLSVVKKYVCNFKLSNKIVKMLPKWGMVKPIWYIRSYLRLVYITFDKIKRMKD